MYLPFIKGFVFVFPDSAEAEHTLWPLKLIPIRLDVELVSKAISYVRLILPSFWFTPFQAEFLKVQILLMHFSSFPLWTTILLICLLKVKVIIHSIVFSGLLKNNSPLCLYPLLILYDVPGLLNFLQLVVPIMKKKECHILFKYGWARVLFASLLTKCQFGKDSCIFHYLGQIIFLPCMKIEWLQNLGIPKKHMEPIAVLSIQKWLRNLKE